MDETVRAELERIHDEDRRQNKRLDALEEQGKVLSDLAMSVQRLAIGVETLSGKQDEMNSRLEEIERRPATAWTLMTRTIITTIAGAIAGGIVVILVQAIASQV